MNKLGDPVHKVASRVVYGLEKIVHKYSNLKESVLDEVEKMLFRYELDTIQPVSFNITVSLLMYVLLFF